MKYVGSWTVLCDVAGRVNRRNDNPLVTIAAVAVAPEVREQVRSRLQRALGQPVKWADGALDGLRRVLPLIRTYALPVLVKHVHRETPEAWERFWRDGDLFAKRLEEIVGERTRYLTSDAILKTILYIGVFGALAGHLLAMRRLPAVRQSDRALGIELTVINDMDIEDAETRRLFAEYVGDWPNVTGFMAEIGIEPHTTVRFEREQDEPLLLLPDYMTGACHHADGRAKLFKPVASPDAVRALIEPFCVQHGNLFVRQEDEFNEKYPLDFEGGVVARRRRPIGQP